MTRPAAGDRERYAELPYAAGWAPLLGPLRRAFLVINRWGPAPLLRAGLGPILATPVAGSILLLRTTGRSTGLVREAPLGYAVVDGRVVVCAGYGRAAHWFRNALAHPEVEIVLPGAVLAGRAEEIMNPVERRATYRTLIRSMGLVGRLTVGDLDAAPDARVDELAEELPMLAITPTAVLAGPYDPGGRFWRIPLAATLAASVAASVAAVGALSRRRRSRQPSGQWSQPQSRHGSPER